MNTFPLVAALRFRRDPTRSARCSDRKYSWPRLGYLCGLVLLGSYYVKMGRYPAYDWIMFLSALGVSIRALVQYSLPKIQRPLVLAGGLIMASGLLTIPRDAHGPIHGAHSVLLYLYLMLVWIPLASVVLRKWCDIRAAGAALVVGMTVTGLYAVGQKFLGWPILGERVQFWGRMTGLTRHPNELGTFCAMVLPYALALILTATHQFARMFWSGCLAVGIGALMLSGSMTGFLASWAGIGYFLWMYKRHLNVRTAGTLALLMVGITMSGVLLGTSGAQSTLHRVQDFMQTSGGRVTLYERLEGDAYAWRAISDNPIVGRGYHAKAHNVDTEIHNGLLRAWYDGGLFALLAVLVVLAGAWGAIQRTWHEAAVQGRYTYRVWVAGAKASFLSFLVVISASPTLYQRSSWFVVALVFAVAAVARRERACS